jgi:hypothetical protein
MLLGLGLSLVLGLVLLVLGLSSSLLSDKQRGQVLADAASLSVANWYAQALNYQAYANRAILANEVMMAQSLTALAWSKHAETLVNNTGSFASFLPALRVLAGWASQAAQASRVSAELAARTEIPIRSGYTRVLAASQEAMRLAVNPFATQTLVNEVVWSGDRRFFGQYLPSSDVSAYYRLVKTYAGGERAPFASLVTGELDSFTRARGYTQRLYLLPTTSCIPTSIDRLFHRMVRRGGTALSADYSEWEAIDTLSAHQWRRRSWWNRTCGGHREAFPMAWGASDASVPVRPGVAAHGGSGINPSARSLASGSSAAITGYLGLSAYRDLSQTSPEQRKAAGAFRIPVLVRLPARNTLADRLFAQSSQSLTTQAMGSALWSLSTAEVRFVDLQGQNLPNLFLPFWRVQRVSSSLADQAAALAVANARKEN